MKYSDQTMQSKLTLLAAQQGYPTRKEAIIFMARMNSCDPVPGICMDCSEGHLVDADSRTSACSACGGENVWSAIELFLCSDFE